MDVRLSPEQLALRDSAAQMMDRLAPHAVRDLDDIERKVKLDAAVDATGWRDLRVASDGRYPLASVVEAAIIAEELGRGLADTAFLGPTLAADLRRRSGAGAPKAAKAWPWSLISPLRPRHRQPMPSWSILMMRRRRWSCSLRGRAGAWPVWCPAPAPIEST